MSNITEHGSERLETVDRLAYDMSQASYVAPDKRPRHIHNYEYDPFSSNTDTAVYHNHATKKTHVSNRGSTSAYDWLVSDAQIGVGAEGYGSRFQRAVKQTKKAHSKYGYDVETSGHSLGGSVSAYTTEQLGDQDWYKGGTGYNPGQSSLGRASSGSKQRRECNNKKDRPAYCGKQTSVIEEGDYVSGRNVACNVITLGLGGKMCRKEGYGKTKYFQHNYKDNLGQGIQNFTNHSLSNFE